MTRAESDHVVRTLRTLELLADEPRTQTALARALGVHPRTAGRLLRRLIEEGYAARTDDRRGLYGPTLKLIAIAGRVLARTDVGRTAILFLTELRGRLEAASHLTVPAEGSAIQVLYDSGDADVIVRSRLGERVPYHASAAGKALLAYLPDIMSRILTDDLRSYTSRTITDRTALLIEVARVRESGFAIEDREFSDELRAVAAAVFDHNGACIATIGVVAPLNHLPTERLEEYGSIVADAASRFSTSIGSGLRLPSHPPPAPTFGWAGRTPHIGERT